MGTPPNSLRHVLLTTSHQWVPEWRLTGMKSERASFESCFPEYNWGLEQVSFPLWWVMDKGKAAVRMDLSKTLHMQRAAGETSALACPERPQPSTGCWGGLYAEGNGLSAWQQGPALSSKAGCTARCRDPPSSPLLAQGQTPCLRPQRPESSSYSRVPSLVMQT